MVIIKQNLLFPVIILSIISFIYRPAFAAGPPPGPVGLATPQICFMKDRDGRLQYAKDLLSFIKQIDDQIPALSPSQGEWLEKELTEYRKTRDIKRFDKISKTREYIIDAVKRRLAGMMINLNSIIEGPPLNKEVFLWSLVADYLMEYELWSYLHILIEKFQVVDIKLINSDTHNKIDREFFYLNNGTTPAWQILRNVIEPYLKQQERISSE
jgi:hypothetical protein